MVITPFGDLRLGDAVALEAWIDAHARKHSTLNRAAKVSGGGQLRGPIDGDWMYRHWARHVALATHTALDLSSTGTKALALPGMWRTDQELLDWHDLHNRIHLKQDRQLKLSG
jgi:hypothetical protein